MIVPARLLKQYYKQNACMNACFRTFSSLVPCFMLQFTGGKSRHLGGITRHSGGKTRNAILAPFWKPLECPAMCLNCDYCIDRATILVHRMPGLQPLESRTLSTDSLDRGVKILKSQTMSLESDPEYQKLLEEKNRLMVSRKHNCFCCSSWCCA